MLSQSKDNLHKNMFSSFTCCHSWKTNTSHTTVPSAFQPLRQISSLSVRLSVCLSVNSLLRIRRHPPLHPRPRPGSLGIQLLLGQLVILKSGMRGRHMAALFEARSLQELEQPLFQMGEWLERDACPGYLSVLDVLMREIGRIRGE